MYECALPMPLIVIFGCGAMQMFRGVSAIFVLAKRWNPPHRVLLQDDAAFSAADVRMYFSIRGVAPFFRISSSQMRWMRGS